MSFGHIHPCYYNPQAWAHEVLQREKEVQRFRQLEELALLKQFTDRGFFMFCVPYPNQVSPMSYTSPQYESLNYQPIPTSPSPPPNVPAMQPQVQPPMGIQASQPYSDKHRMQPKINTALIAPGSMGQDNVYMGADKFEIKLSLHGFRPDDIEINICERKIEICAIHQSEGRIEGDRTFTRVYHLQRPINVHQGMWCYTDAGILLISAPWQK